MLRIMAGSQHLYNHNLDAASVVSSSKDAEDGVFNPITLAGLYTPDDLLNCLCDIRNEPNNQVLQRLQGELCPVLQ